MTPQTKPHEHRNGEGHAAGRRTDGDAQVKSHRATAQRVRAADRFALQLPIVGRVPIPRPDQLAFYGALAGLVAVELVDWPVAVAIGVGHALISGQPEQRSSHEPGAKPE